MKKNKEDNKSSVVLVTILVVILLIVMAIGGYFVGATKFTSSLIKEREKSTKNESSVKDVITKESSIPRRACVGTYKGTGPVSVNALTNEKTNGEYTLTLQEDDSFDFRSEFNSYTGHYLVIRNTLILMYLKEITGPEDQAPVMNAATRLISEDCSTVTVKGFVGEDLIVLNRQ